MSDKQAGVIYRRVNRSDWLRDHEEQHLCSFVAGQGTLVPCAFMCFRETFKPALMAFLFVFVFFLSTKLHF